MKYEFYFAVAAVLCLTCASGGVLLAGVVPSVATIHIAGQSCPFAGGAGLQRTAVIAACGNVYLCAPGGSFNAASVLTITGPCASDRVFGGGFEL